MSTLTPGKPERLTFDEMTVWFRHQTSVVAKSAFYLENGCEEVADLVARVRAVQTSPTAIREATT